MWIFLERSIFATQYRLRYCVAIFLCFYGGDILSKGYYAWMVFLGGCSYGILSTIVKIAYEHGISTAEVCGSQGLFGMLLLWSIAWRWKKAALGWKRTMGLILSGSVIGCTTIFYYKSLETLPASLAIIFLFQFVWIGCGLEWIFFHRRPDRQKIIALGLLLIGSLFATGVQLEQSSLVFTPGMLWGFLAALTYSLLLLISGTVGRDVPPIFKSALMSLGASGMIFIFFPPIFLTDVSTLIALCPYGILLGAFGIALPPLLFSLGIPHVGTGLGSILTASELPVAILLASFVLGEQLVGGQWFGIVLILGGIILGNLRRR